MTSRSGQQSSELSESEFLAYQAAEARAAMERTRRALTEQSKELLNLRTWVPQYPWISVGAASAVGFLTASTITPTRKETFKHRMQSLFPQAPTQPDGTAAAPRGGGRSLLGKAAKPLLNALRGAVVASLSSAITAKARQAGEEMTGGQPAPAGPEQPVSMR